MNCVFIDLETTQQYPKRNIGVCKKYLTEKTVRMVLEMYRVAGTVFRTKYGETGVWHGSRATPRFSP